VEISRGRNLLEKGTRIELSDNEKILLFFLGVMATVTASVVTSSVFPTSRISYVVAFLLSGIVGGILTTNPISGSISGLVGGICFTSIFIDSDEIFLWVYLLYSFGGFIGGITGKILYNKIKRLKPFLNGW
jgi:uncharacterized membrane protein YhhN